MVAIALLGGVLAFERGTAAVAIPLLGTLALGAQRLLPALQQIYIGWVGMKSNNASLRIVLDMLNQPLPREVSVAQPMAFREAIRLEGVHFFYGNDQPKVLHLERN